MYSRTYDNKIHKTPELPYFCPMCGLPDFDNGQSIIKEHFIEESYGKYVFGTCCEGCKDDLIKLYYEYIAEEMAEFYSGVL